MTSPSGFHGHGGTARLATSLSIARTIARTPSVGARHQRRALRGLRSLISDVM